MLIEIIRSAALCDATGSFGVWPFQLKGCVAVGAHVMDIPPNGKGVNSSVTTLSSLQLRWGNRQGLTATIRSGA